MKTFGELKVRDYVYIIDKYHDHDTHKSKITRINEHPDKIGSLVLRFGAQGSASAPPSRSIAYCNYTDYTYFADYDQYIDAIKEVKKGLIREANKIKPVSEL